MELLRIMVTLPAEDTLPVRPRPYANHAFVPVPVHTARQRAEALEHVGFNAFFFPSEMVAGCDLLSDSGTTSMTNEQWAALLLAEYRHHACELGCLAFGEYNPEAGTETFPANNYLCFAVPRLRYEHQDLESVAKAMRILYERRGEIPGVSVAYGRELPLRHFKARFEFKKRAPLESLTTLEGISPS